MDSSRPVMTRKLEMEKIWENYIVPDISLLETDAIYDLTMHAVNR